MTQAVIITGKNGDMSHYLEQPPDKIAYNSGTVVQNYEGVGRPQVNGLTVQVINDTASKVVFKVFSDCKSKDCLGEKPSADLWLFLPPQGIGMGWIVYNCDFNLNIGVEKNGTQYQCDWKWITTDDASKVYGFAVSTLLEEEEEGQEPQSFLVQLYNLMI